MSYNAPFGARCFLTARRVVPPVTRENVVPDRQWPKKHPSGQQARGQITRLFVTTARIAALDTNTLTTADPITRAILAESVRETLERRLAAERPHGTYDDTRAGHDAFGRGLVDDYDHGNHHLARATIRVADLGLVTCAGLSTLNVPDTDATIIDELAQASDPNPIASVLADAALLDLDRYATGRGLLYSRVGTALMLAAPNEQRLTDVTTQYIDEEKALASIGVDPWDTRSSDEPTGKADRILYVGRDGARPCQSGPCPRRRARLAACHLRPQKQRHAHRPVRKRRPVRRRALVGDAQWRRRRVPVAARLLPRHTHRCEQGSARQSAPRASGPRRRP